MDVKFPGVRSAGSMGTDPDTAFGWSPSCARCRQSRLEKGALRSLQGCFNCGISLLFSQDEEEDVTAFVLSPDDEVGLCWGL